MKYTRIPEDTFKNLQMNAGILTKNFNPATGEVTDIFGATKGGLKFNSNPKFQDYGADIDNCPENTMQLKKLVSYDPQLTGTFLSVTAAIVKSLIGSADIDTDDNTKIVPREDLLEADFDDIWLVGDYSDVNTGEGAGFLAIHIMNALNTGGLAITTSKSNKGELAIDYHGHYDIDDTSVVPFEVYVKAGA